MGAANILHRGDIAQSAALSDWISELTEDYNDAILPFDQDISIIEGVAQCAHYETHWIN